MSSQSQLRSIFNHTFIYSIATFLQKAVGFLMLPVYANYFGPEGYGIVGMIDVVLAVLAMSIGYGVTGGMQRFYYVRQTENDRNILVSSTIMLMSLLVVAVSSPALIFSNQIAALAFGQEGMGYYIVLAIFTFMADMTATSAAGYILIKQRSKLYTSLSIFRLTLGLSLNIYFIITLKMGILGLLYSNLITTFVYSAVVHAYAFGRVGFKFNKKDAREILRYSLPLVPGSLAMLVRNNADGVMLRTFMGLALLGTYSMLNKFSTLINILLLQPFFQIWSVKRFEICEDEDGPQIMARVFTLQIASMFFMGLILSVEIPLILRVMTPKEFWVPGIYAFLAVFSRILFACYYHFQFGLSYAKLTGRISQIQVAASVFSLLSNLILVKFFGLLGALIASCLIYLFQSSLTYFLSKKHYAIPFDWPTVIKMTAATFLLFLLIDKVSLSSIGLDFWAKDVGSHLASSVANLFPYDHKILSKLLNLFETNFLIVIEAFVKFLLCFLLTFPLVYLKVISFRQLLRPFDFFMPKRIFQKVPGTP